MRRSRFLSGLPARAFGLALLALALGAGATARAEIAGTVTAVEEDGFARIVFRFDKAPDLETRVTNGIVVVRSTEPIAVPIDRVPRQVATFISAARRDPDGRGLRFALARKSIVNPMLVGERLFLDILPANWQGEPPALPAEVIEELTLKAREAERLKAEEAARRLSPDLATIDVRTAVLPTFSRLTFALERPAPVQLVRDKTAVRLSFDAPITAEVERIKADLPPRLVDIAAEPKDGRLNVTLTVPEDVDVRAFWDEANYTLDLSGGADTPVAVEPGLEAALREAAGRAGATTLPATTLPGTTLPGTTLPGTAPAPTPVQAPGEAVPVPNEATVEPGEAGGPMPAPVAGSAPGPVAASAPAEPPADVRIEPAVPARTAAATTPGEDPATLRPIVQDVTNAVRVTFPFTERTPAALLRRGATLFLLLETERPIDPAPIAEEAKRVVRTITVTPMRNAVLLRIGLADAELATLSADGEGWVLSIGEDILQGAAPVAMTRSVDSEGRTTLTAAVQDVGSVHQIIDPEAGDAIDLVPLPAPPRAFLKPQTFVEVRGLVTAHGLAFVRGADDVAVTTSVDMLTVTRDGGLTLSAVDKDTRDAAPAEERLALFDVASWQDETKAPPVERQRELFDAIVNASPENVGAARMGLGRFFVAHGFAAEASAQLARAAEADPNLNRLPEFSLLQAMAAVDLGRGDEANKLLSDSGLNASADGSLIRAMAEAEEGRWGLAREAFVKGGDALPLFPPALRARLHLVAYQAALEANDLADAANQQAALADLPVAERDGARRSLLDARLHDLNGRKAEALAGYRAVIDGPDAAAAAEARLRAAPLRRDLGQADDKALLDELETLAAVWRGDDIEARTIRSLAQEYLRLGRYRAAFDQMQVALEHHPRSSETRALQDEMTQVFARLFLDGEADRMAPLDALALFYDYRGLTPVDNRGDEMIRKLADRLMEVDLLDQAADLLTHQVENRLTGAARAQVGARLALVNLMNRKPMQALKVLDETRQQDLPQALREARLVLEARALSETARPDLALEILDAIRTDESSQLRADVLWQARRWQPAGEAIEAMLGEAWNTAAPLDDASRTQVMRAAIAYSLAEDRIGLDRLRTKYSAKMSGSPDASAFETVTAPIDARGTAFRDIAKSIAQTDTLAAFVTDYRARHDPAPEPAAEPAAAPAPPPAAALPGGQS